MLSRPFVPMTSRVRPPHVGAVRGWLQEQSTLAMEPLVVLDGDDPARLDLGGRRLLQDAVGDRTHPHRGRSSSRRSGPCSARGGPRGRRPQTTAAGSTRPGLAAACRCWCRAATARCPVRQPRPGPSGGGRPGTAAPGGRCRAPARPRWPSATSRRRRRPSWPSASPEHVATLPQRRHHVVVVPGVLRAHDDGVRAGQELGRILDPASRRSGQRRPRSTWSRARPGR